MSGTDRPLDLEALARRLRDGEVLAVVGAEVAVAGGLPSWPALVRHVVDYGRRACERAHERQALDAIAGDVARRDWDAAISGLNAVLGPEAYADAIASALDDADLPVPALARALAELAPSLRAVITTNLDRFLERAFGAWHVMTRGRLDLAQRRHFILKLGGTLADRRTWAQSRGEGALRRALGPEEQEVLRALYLGRTFMFVGDGAHDPALEHLLRFVCSLADEQPPRHYALIAHGQRDAGRERRLARAGILSIHYDDADGQHLGLLRALRHLAEVVRGGASVEDRPDPPQMLAQACAPVDLLRLSFVAANPPYTEKSGFDREERALRDRVEHAVRGRGRVEMKTLLAARLLDLQQELLERRPHVLHLAVHGERGGLVLDGEPGATVVAAELVDRLLRLGRRECRLVYFAVCDSEELAREAVRHVCAAVGVADRIEVPAAIAASAAFYAAIFAGGSVQEALESARLALESVEPGSGERLHLFTAEGVDPSRMTLLP